MNEKMMQVMFIISMQQMRRGGELGGKELIVDNILIVGGCDIRRNDEWMWAIR